MPAPLPPINPLAKLYAIAKRKTIKLHKNKKIPLRIRCINWNFYEKLRLEYKGAVPGRKRSHGESGGGGSPVEKQAKMEDVGSQKMKNSGCLKNKKTSETSDASIVGEGYQAAGQEKNNNNS